MGRTPNDELKPSVTKESIKRNSFAWNVTRAQNISWSASFVEYLLYQITIIVTVTFTLWYTSIVSA